MFHSPWKSWNSIPFLSIIAGTSKQHKRMPHKVFHGNIKALGCFKAWFVCILLRFSPEFPVDPYYESLAWFMLNVSLISKCSLMFYFTIHTYILACVFNKVVSLYQEFLNQAHANFLPEHLIS